MSNNKFKLNEKNKKIINISVTVVQIILVLLAVIASIVILANPGTNTIGKTSTRLLPVLSNSMVGPNKDSFKKGDLIVSKKPDGKKYNAEKLQVDQIITFQNSRKMLVTHRIIEVLGEGSNVKYITQGDNNPLPDNDPPNVFPSQVLGIYKSHIKGVGSFIAWLQKPTNFLLLIILPLALLFIYNIVILVKMIMDNKVAKAKATAATTGIDTEGLSEEEIKQKIIEEYLAKQSAVPVETTESKPLGDSGSESDAGIDAEAGTADAGEAGADGGTDGDIA